LVATTNPKAHPNPQGNAQSAWPSKGSQEEEKKEKKHHTSIVFISQQILSF
jgi:hypothetical protein